MKYAIYFKGTAPDTSKWPVGIAVEKEGTDCLVVTAPYFSLGTAGYMYIYDTPDWTEGTSIVYIPVDNTAQVLKLLS